MVVGLGRIVLHIPESRSLKDKRQVMRPALAQVRHRFDVVAAEVDDLDLWQRGVIGIACLSTSAAHADEVLAKAIQFISDRAADAEVTDYETEILHVW